MGLDVLFPTNFRFDHHVVLCLLLERTEFWVRAQRSYCFNVICLIWWQLISFVSNRESSLLCCCLFWSFCSESTSLTLRCHALASEESMTATQLVFRAKYSSPPSDWLKVFGDSKFRTFCYGTLFIRLTTTRVCWLENPKSPAVHPLTTRTTLRTKLATTAHEMGMGGWINNSFVLFVSLICLFVWGVGIVFTEWTGLQFAKSQRAVETREKWRKLVVKSSVVPQRPSRLRDRWGEKYRLNMYVRLCQQADMTISGKSLIRMYYSWKIPWFTNLRNRTPFVSSSLFFSDEVMFTDLCEWITRQDLLWNQYRYNS